MRYFIDDIDDGSKHKYSNGKKISPTTKHNRRSSWINGGGVSLRNIFSSSDDNANEVVDGLNQTHNKERSNTKHNRRSSWINGGGVSLRNIFSSIDNNENEVVDGINKTHNKERSKSLI